MGGAQDGRGMWEEHRMGGAQDGRGMWEEHRMGGACGRSTGWEGHVGGAQDSCMIAVKACICQLASSKLATSGEGISVLMGVCGSVRGQSINE